MNQDRACGALPGRLLELVRPTSVVRENLSQEYGRIDQTRIVHEHQQDFSVEIGALVVVPLPFRGANAVADEHDVTVGGDVGLRSLAPRDERVPISKTLCGPARLPPRERGLRRHPDERDRLEVGPTCPGGLEP